MRLLTNRYFLFRRLQSIETCPHLQNLSNFASPFSSRSFVRPSRNKKACRNKKTSGAIKIRIRNMECGSSQAQGFTGEQIESGPTPLTVLEALKVVLVILVILHPSPPLFLAHIPRQRIAARPLTLPHSGLVTATEEDRWRRRRRQLRPLKTPLKVSGQDRVYRVCLGAACKTEITLLW